MSVDKHLLEILVCPVTRVGVSPMSRDRLAILNREVANGQIRRRDGTPQAEPLEEALVTTDGKTIYPVEEGIPLMLEEAGIAAHQVPGW